MERNWLVMLVACLAYGMMVLVLPQLRRDNSRRRPPMKTLPPTLFRLSVGVAKIVAVRIRASGSCLC